ncbi:ATP-binding protein [Streptomyces sp. NPDC087844]|uniref:ATP-binding protein n=1 Tax=Streptomyces sp. NPDC087844 TaxID=3365805 RepID=UPI0037FA567F
MSLCHRAEAAGAARRATAVVLADWQLADDAAEAVVLVVSELVTNAVEHGQPPLTLLLRHPSGHGHSGVRIEVSDGGPASRPGAWASSCDADERGRGLGIVEALASSHGFRAQPHRTTYWAALPSS